MNMRHARLALSALLPLLALVVVVMGAWVRLSDAGLGCPDWPGCYGSMVVTEQTRQRAEQQRYSDSARPYDQDKAKKEMLHRYAAGLLGLLLLLLTVLIWREGHAARHLRGLVTGILLLVVLQAMLGMWTVLWRLQPLIVLLHLIGGVSILSLLYWLFLRQCDWIRAGGMVPDARLRNWGCIGLLVLCVQIGLGGWVSANYAALVCPDFPACRGQWLPEMDFRAGFQPWQEGLDADYEGGRLSVDARTAIHMTHRAGAIIALTVLAVLGMLCLRRRQLPLRCVGALLLGLLLLQAGFGVANVLLRLPLLIATGHNAVAALLLLVVITILHFSGALTRR